MASIYISDLSPVGSDLFADSESYMRDLSDIELGTQGGITPVLIVAAASSEVCGIGIAAGIVWLFGQGKRN